MKFGKLSEAEIANKRRSLFRLLKVYLICGVVPLTLLFLFIFWMSGYAVGYLDGRNNRPQILQSESSK